MHIVYTLKELREIIKEYHRYGGTPIKIGYDHKEIGKVTLDAESSEIFVELTNEEDTE